MLKIPFPLSGRWRQELGLARHEVTRRAFAPDINGHEDASCDSRPSSSQWFPDSRIVVKNHEQRTPVICDQASQRPLALGCGCPSRLEGLSRPT